MDMVLPSGLVIPKRRTVERPRITLPDKDKFLARMGFRQPPPFPGVRPDLVQIARGCYSESFPLDSIPTGGRTSASGRVWYTPIGLDKGDIVTGFLTYHSTGGSNVTIYQFGLYSNAGVLLASSVNSVASALALYFQTLPMATPYRVTTEGNYFVGMLCVNTTTSPGWVIPSSTPLEVRNPKRAGFNAIYYTDAGPYGALPASFNKAVVGLPPGTLGQNYVAVY